MKPGEIFTLEGNITLNEGRETVSVKVKHTGDRPVQVGSHFHFFEVNKELEFDREASFGFHLNIPAGTAVRFEPGEEKEVELVMVAGNKKVFGLNNLTDGSISEDNKRVAIKRAIEKGFIKED